MAYFAKLDENNIVLEIHSVHNNELLDSNGVEQELLGYAFLKNWSGGYQYWKQTSFNGRIRKNPAGIGYSYDLARDAFVPPKPFASWVLNEDTCQWEPPVPRPEVEGKYFTWNEATTSWDEFVQPT